MGMEWMPQINLQICTGCGDCVTVCPTGALELRADKAVVTQPLLCTYCSACEDVCPVSAIDLPYLVVKGGPTEGAEL
ncbi:MAG: hypothetical protein BroJett033_8300 [Chloroflexota bacterium]|nr:MAG: hypothetical protein BroJett033_8300 [Chloroflexota bacterium]